MLVVKAISTRNTNEKKSCEKLLPKKKKIPLFNPDIYI